MGLSLPLSSCAPDESKYGKDAKDPTKTYSSIFKKDKNHTDGFHLAVHPNTNEYGKYKHEDIYLTYNGKGKESNINWELTQWWSPKQIGLQTSTYSYDEANNTHSYTAPARQVKCKPDTNDVYFKTDTSIEYEMLYGEKKLPKANADANQWSHSLLQCNFESWVKLVDISSFVLDFDITIHNCTFKGKSDADMSGYEGASQIFIYFTLFESIKGGYGKVMWFGVPIYDSRYNQIAEYYRPDIWSGLPIYSLPNNLYLPVNNNYGLKMNRKYHVSIDMINYFKDIYFGSDKWEGVYPTADRNNVYCEYINYGFEMPGAFDMSATISNLDISIAK